ncbi:MAG TPA: DUF937 domain-containing protein, partial [Methylomirabilota bacterium]
MNILDAILNAQNGAAVQQVSSRVGLDERQTASALSALIPALAAGFQRNAQREGGLESLASALATGRHQQYLEQPSTLRDPDTVADGNGILGHVFGSKEVSREVASRAAARTGVSTDIMKQLLPLAAAMVMGAMSKQQSSPAAGAGGAAVGSEGGLLGMLTPLLDSNRDGSIVDDVSGILGRFMR